MTRGADRRRPSTARPWRNALVTHSVAANTGSTRDGSIVVSSTSRTDTSLSIGERREGERSPSREATGRGRGQPLDLGDDERQRPAPGRRRGPSPPSASTARWIRDTTIRSSSECAGRRRVRRQCAGVRPTPRLRRPWARSICTARRLVATRRSPSVSGRRAPVSDGLGTRPDNRARGAPHRIPHRGRRVRSTRLRRARSFTGDVLEPAVLAPERDPHPAPSIVANEVPPRHPRGASTPRSPQGDNRHAGDGRESSHVEQQPSADVEPASGPRNARRSRPRGSPATATSTSGGGQTRRTAAATTITVVGAGLRRPSMVSPWRGLGRGTATYADSDRERGSSELDERRLEDTRSRSGQDKAFTTKPRCRNTTSSRPTVARNHTPPGPRRKSAPGTTAQPAASTMIPAASSTQPAVRSIAGWRSVPADSAAKRTLLRRRRRRKPSRRAASSSSRVCGGRGARRKGELVGAVAAMATSDVLQLRLVVEVDDFDAAVAFYRDVLGLPEQAAFEGDGDRAG